MDVRLVIRVLQAFERERVAYKVFGGVAVNVHGIARATQALDVFVAATEDNIARLRAALRSVWDDPSIDEITFEDLAGDYPALQYVPPSEDFHIDVLTRLGEAYDFDAVEAVRRDLGDVTITVASPRQLYEMKRGTVRHKDALDAMSLRARYDLEED